MSRMIKSRLLREVEPREEYLVEANGSDGRSRRSRRSKTASPEDAARAMIARARAEAGALVSAAQLEADSIRSSARQEGHEAARRELESERQAAAERLVQIEEEAARQVEQFWVSMEPELLRLAVGIAGKVVRKEISENEEFVLTNVKEGLLQLRDRHELTMRVNPRDYDLMREQKEDIAGSLDGIRSIEIVDDRRVDEGGCVIESGNGNLDARIETQLKEVERALLEAAHDGKCAVPAEP